MIHSKQLAKNFTALHIGPNFVGSSLKEALEGVGWEQATTRVHGLNTIAMLVFHINYYVSAVIKVLQGGPLDAHDKYSYDMPTVSSEADWQEMLDKTWSEAEDFTSLVEKMSEEQLKELMAGEKYGNWFRNLLGLQEHSYYHLGQIVLIRKITDQQ